MDTYKKVGLGVAGATGAALATWRTMFPWIGYDLHYLRKVIPIVRAKSQSENGRYLIDMFEDRVRQNPQKTFIIFEDQFLSYKFIDDQANKVANIVGQWGLHYSDVVTMLINNEPAFIWTYLGLQKLGVAASLINYNLREEALAHCIKSTDSQIFIIGQGEELLQAVNDVREQLTHMKVYVQGTASNLPAQFFRFDELFNSSPVTPIPRNVRAGLHPFAYNCYIFTSGTTGVPKAAPIMQMKVYMGAHVLRLVDLASDDILYVTLPLYHTAATYLGVNGCICAGATVVLRRKFSANEFWDDCRKYNVTGFLYIGELCRYLLARPKLSTDRKNKVRFAMGNGLRPDIWDEFVKRFKIPQIMEIYGCTEGPAAFINISNKPGACGRFSPFLALFEIGSRALVKYDAETTEPLRDKDGRCIKIKTGEAGLMIGAFPPDVPVTLYAGKKESEKRMVRNAFKDGDEYFNFGDVLHLDKDYFIYFHDRIGDTFRWKGENVSTIEVSNALVLLDFIEDANVYGVPVSGADGKAGMVAIKLKGIEELSDQECRALYKHCTAKLPGYARPLFIRIVENIEITSTFKHRKINVAQEGFNPHKVSDKLFYLNSKKKTYLPLDAVAYNTILEVKARL